MEHVINISSNCGHVWDEVKSFGGQVHIPRIGEHYTCSRLIKWRVVDVNTQYIKEGTCVRVFVKVAST